jgi:lysophospholipase L1-like esterase
MADENGYLYNSLTNDGCHPTGSGYRIWKNWLHWAVKQLPI